MAPDRPAEDDEGLDYDVNEDIYPFPIERFLQELAPGVLQAQNAWMASIDSLRAPDRKTHELIRMVCTVIARLPGGVERHARLAAEVGASWEEIAGSILSPSPPSASCSPSRRFLPPVAVTSRVWRALTTQKTTRPANDRRLIEARATKLPDDVVVV
jgi:hypothetical protein